MRAGNASTIVDGNAIAGMLLDIFGADATVLVGTCAGCGSEARFAQAVVELDRQIAIVRCRSCTRTLFTVLHEQADPRLVIGTLGAIRA